MITYFESDRIFNLRFGKCLTSNRLIGSNDDGQNYSQFPLIVKHDE